MGANIIIATAPCSWGVWYADGKPSGTPWEVFLDQAAAAGYTALELGPDGYLPQDAAVLREELARRHLEVCAGTACYQFDHHKRFEDFRDRLAVLCKRLKAFDAKYLVTMDESDVGSYSEKKKDYTPDVWENYFAMFKAMGIFTKNEYGIETVFHPHIKTLIETEDEILRMLDHSNLRLCFDTGHHAYVNGGDTRPDRSAVDFISAHRDRIAYLHFKNVDGEIRKKVAREGLDSDTAFDLEVMCDLRDGIIDFVELKQTLDAIGFSGVGVIEMDMPHATADQAFAAAKRNLAYLRETGLIK
jgi:inosose dehydratase